MSSSEEYLASLGIDTSDVDKAVNQTISILGHLGAQFDDVSKRSEKAQKALGATGTASKTAATAQEKQAAAAAKQAAAAEKAAQSALPRLRYALYDVSFASAIAGAALLAGGVAVEKTAIEYEALFASVDRTSKGLNSVDLSNLRGQLIDITSEIPKSFDNITEIATLGNQLDVPAGALANFTEVVAKFSSTTDETASAAATDFGRLGQLLKTTDYRGLGDDIAYLGVNSVATESQIAKVAQQIAVSTQAANYGVGPTLALATALASLGIKPEQARGSILRTFSTINAAVASGGKKLNDLAAISGKTSADFASQWRTDAQGAFREFLNGLSKDSAGLDKNLASLGITATRDRQTLGLLAQNQDVLTAATNDLSNATGYLDKSFDKIAQTTASKLTIAGNNVKRIFDSIGQATNGPVATGLDIINHLLLAFDHGMNDAAAAGGVALSLVLTGIAGIALIVYAAFLRLAATMIAIQTASGGAAEGQSIFRTALSAVQQGLFGVTAAATGTVAAETAVGEAGVAAAAGQDAMAASGSKATGAATKLGGVLGKAGLIGSLLAFIPLIPAIVGGLDEMGRQANGSSVDVDTLTQKIKGLQTAGADLAKKGLLQSLSDASSNTYTGNVFKPSDQTPINGAQLVYNKQTTGNPTGKRDVGIFDGGAQVNAHEQNAENQIKSYDAALAKLAQDGNQQAVNDGLAVFHKALADSGLSLAQQNTLLPQTNAALDANAAANTAAGLAAAQAGDDTDAANQAFAGILDSAYSASNASQKLSSDLDSLGAAFATNGSTAASEGSELQSVIQDIYDASGGGPAAAAELQGFFDSLVKGGFASASQLSGLKSVIDQLTGGKGIKGANFSLQGFNSSLKKTAAAASTSGGGAAAAVRTLVDYANDLATVFKRSFELRFGKQQSLDSIGNGWQKIKDETAAANKQIAEYQASLQKLTADKAVKEYFLSVATAYGDSLRQGELRADITDINNQITSTTDDLTNAQKKNSKTTKGNSQAARDNRATLYDMVQQYEAYIQTLAASGLSQDQLAAKTRQAKTDFIAQATALGFSKSAATDAARAFSDVATAIGKVPRNVTIKTNTNPALQAIAELQGKLTKLGGGKYNPTISPKVGDTSSLDSLIKKLHKEMFAQFAASAQHAHPEYGGDYLRQLFVKEFGFTGGWKDGGWTGGNNPSRIAGVVHEQEFVLNKVGAQMIPRQTLEAANRGQAPRFAGASMAGSASMMTSFFPQMLQTLREIARKELVAYVGVDDVGRATDQYNRQQASQGRG